MKKLTVLPAALAAGMLTYAANAEPRLSREKVAEIATSRVTDRQVDPGAKANKEVREVVKQANEAYAEIIGRYAAAYGVPENLARAVVQIESNYRADARGSAGEVGLMQIKPATARMMGYTGSVKGLFQPETNIKYGMKYLARAHELGGGTTCGTILKYNAGHAARRMNPVSSAYCKKVKQQLASN